jgi:hypothetical protein
MSVKRCCRWSGSVEPVDAKSRYVSELPMPWIGHGGFHPTDDYYKIVAETGADLCSSRASLSSAQ